MDEPPNHVQWKKPDPKRHTDGATYWRYLT